MNSFLQEHKRSIVIKGGIRLKGTVKIQGSKNASLPIMAATLLTIQECVLQNCPRISDIYHMLEILELLGAKVQWQKRGLVICNPQTVLCDLSGPQVRTMRSSMFLLGALLARSGKVCMNYPGGCVIGSRPMNIHLEALEQMGARFLYKEEKLCAEVPGGFHGSDITLPFPSVGATENIILAGVLAKGRTRVFGGAKEPEIVSLCEFLTACGAKITGAGTDLLSIEGVESLHGCSFCLPTDRIVAGTYAYAVAATGGEAFLERAPIGHMEAPLTILEKMGAELQRTMDGLYVQGPERIHGIGYLKTKVYPGFPTDLQSIALASLMTATEMTVIEEGIFDNRFAVAKELEKMGGRPLLLDKTVACIDPVQSLYGTGVEAKDLRGGAALVLAGLMASGETRVYGVDYIERGYENICRDIRELGGVIYLSGE